MSNLRIPHFSLQGRLTVAMALMLCFLVASGLIGLYAVDGVVNDLNRVGDAAAEESSSMRDLAGRIQARDRKTARSLREMDDAFRSDVDDKLEGAETARDSALTLIGLVCVVGFAAVAGMSFLLARSIRRPLKELKRGVDEFARGNLDYRLSVYRNDELGNAVEMFNRMAAAVQGGQRDLAHQAFHDPLTDLPNRDLFKDRVGHALARQLRDHRPLAVMFVDLDDFKTVNDSLGHAAGDQLPITVAQRLVGSVRPSDTVARLGGDEFAVLVEEMRGHRDALRVAERIIDSLSESLVVEGKEMCVPASVGIAITYGEVQIDELLRNADLAMYAAKRSGKGRFEIFHSSMNEGVLERLELKADLQRAVERNEFVVYYQPLVELESRKVVGAEALVRWQHPERGLVPPADFIPLAEETGIIIPLGRFVMEEACYQVREWQHHSGTDLKISVNLSGKQFQEPSLVSEISRILREAPLAPDGLTIEITESSLMHDTKATIQKLNQLRNLGVHVAIDDFGTGYSSLNYLRRFPIETVKIDKSFIDGIAHGPEDSALARAILKLAHTLGMDTVAEGVTSEEQAGLLHKLGCRIGQGSCFGAPMPAEVFEQLLTEQMSSEAFGFDLPAKGPLEPAGGPRGRSSREDVAIDPHAGDPFWSLDRLDGGPLPSYELG